MISIDFNTTFLVPMSDNTETKTRPPEVSGSQSAKSDPGKPVVLALWASLKMAEELAEFCESGFETIKKFDFDVHPASEVEKLSSNGCDLTRYTAILLAYAEDDGPAIGVKEFVSEWAQYKKSTGESPMIICREGLLPSTKWTRKCEFWSSLVDEVGKEFSADIIRDSRMLFSAFRAAGTE